MGKRVEWYNADGLRFCSGCQDYMSPDLFHKGQSKTPDGLQRQCMLCRRVARRAQYQAHRTRDIAATRAWVAAHPERAKAAERRAHRVYSLGRSLRTGAFERRLARETRRTVEVTRVRTLLRTMPDLTLAQLVDMTGWAKTTSARRLRDARAVELARETARIERMEQAG